MQAHPDVPVVEKLEDLWKVSKLQRERKRKEEKAALLKEAQSSKEDTAPNTEAPPASRDSSGLLQV